MKLCDKCYEEIEVDQLTVMITMGMMGLLSPDNSITRWYHYDCYIKTVTCDSNSFRYKEWGEEKK